MEWPPFDVRITKFQMKQCSDACDIDLVDHRLFCALALTFNHNALRSVEFIFRKYYFELLFIFTVHSSR